jgi:hypothetical protein
MLSLLLVPFQSGLGVALVSRPAKRRRYADALRVLFIAPRLLTFHAKIADELRERGITRTANNPTGDLAEHLFRTGLKGMVSNLDGSGVSRSRTSLRI